jgi:hypothetical protein
MKRSLFYFIIFIFITSSLLAQGFRDVYWYPEENTMMGGVGVTWIDNQPYTTFTIAPEFAVGKVGLGLYLQLLLDNKNNYQLRKVEYEGEGGILRAIRYVRYGNKYDPFYARFGMLEMASLANGFLLWNYNNASSYDKRKWGLAFDLDLEKVGLESVIGNFSRLELTGGNIYFRPVRLIAPHLPVIKNLRLYGTYVYDHEVPSWESQGEMKSLNAYGLGVDLVFLNAPVVKSGVYYDYGKFTDFGSGQALGINVIFPDMIGLFGLWAKFERRWIGERFIPSFFGPFYDLDRELDPIEYQEESRIWQLQNAAKTTGYFGQLTGFVIKKLRLIGNYQWQDDMKVGGILHLEALAPDLIPKFELRAYYDKTGIKTFTDMRTLDNKSLATIEIGYRLNMFLVISTIYRWYWVKEEDDSGNVVYRPVERIEPRLSFSFHF